MGLEKWNQTRVMTQRMENTLVLTLWIYLFLATHATFFIGTISLDSFKRAIQTAVAIIHQMRIWSPLRTEQALTSVILQLKGHSTQLADRKINQSRSARNLHNELHGYLSAHSMSTCSFYLYREKQIEGIPLIACACVCAHARAFYNEWRLTPQMTDRCKTSYDKLRRRIFLIVVKCLWAHWIGMF